MRIALRAIVGPLLLGLLAPGAVRAECGEAGERAAAAACSTHSVLCWHALESCSSYSDGRWVSLRFAPRKQHERERRHYELSCWETAPRAWSCDDPRAIRTAQLSDSSDWTKLYGDVTVARASEVADVARAELALAAAHVEYVLENDNRYIVVLKVAGEASSPCLWVTPREGRLAVERVGRLGDC